MPDGKTQIVVLNPGMVVWRDAAFDHAWELLAGEVHVILVEVKSANAELNRRSMKELSTTSAADSADRRWHRARR